MKEYFGNYFHLVFKEFDELKKNVNELKDRIPQPNPPIEIVDIKREEVVEDIET